MATTTGPLPNSHSLTFVIRPRSSNQRSPLTMTLRPRSPNYNPQTTIVQLQSSAHHHPTTIIKPPSPDYDPSDHCRPTMIPSTTIARLQSLQSQSPDSYLSDHHFLTMVPNLKFIINFKALISSRTSK